MKLPFRRKSTNVKLKQEEGTAVLGADLFSGPQADITGSPGPLPGLGWKETRPRGQGKSSDVPESTTFLRLL